jgi:hypothetical protein
MDENLKGQLEMDQAKAESYQRAWDNIVMPFFDHKQKELYEAFVSVGSADVDTLVTIKMQSNVMSMLKDEFNHYINTGKLARKALDEEESNEH